MLSIQQFGEWFFCICNAILGMCAKILESCTRWMWTQKWEWCETFGWKSCGCTQTMVVAVVLFSLWRSNAFLSRKKMFEPCKLRWEAIRIMWRSCQHELQDVSCVFYCFWSDCQLTVVCLQETSENGWYDLVSKGFIEYVDTEEEETTMISMTIAVCFA